MLDARKTLDDKTLIEWNFGDTGMPYGEPLIVCVHELDDASERYVEGPVMAIKPRGGGRLFLDRDNRPLSGIRIYAWAQWPEPVSFAAKRVNRL